MTDPLSTEQKMEFPFTDADFNRLSTLITKRTGIELPEHKKALVYGRLARRLRALNLKDFSSYIKSLEENVKRGNEEELVTAIQAVTTNVTSFFRESHHFDVLKEQLPILLQKHGEVRIWTCACSTGEEPWSLAMVVAEFKKNNPDARISITASDLDKDAIAKAEKGVYPLRPEDVSAHPLLKKYLKPGEAARLPGEVSYTIDSRLRPLVSYQQLNLIEDWKLPHKMHIIFCRNVIIYFGKQTKVTLFEKVAAHTHMGGLLFIGHSETMLGVSDAFKLLGRTAYERV